METYKISTYTILCERGDKSYIWNTLSGALASVDSDMKAALLTDVIEQASCPNFNALKANRFIVPSDFDEYNFVLNRANSIKAKEDPSNMFFVIAPTLKCNYHCPYCFEEGRTSFCHMTEETCSEVKHFITDRVLANASIKTLHITWFGGEPLLCLDKIEDISGYLIDTCSARSIECRFSVITNGRYLDNHAIDVLQKINVKKVQISFDGTQATYCAAKLASVSDYNNTLDNIVLAAKRGLPLFIRINIRNNDFAPAYELADLLLWDKGLANNIKLYPAFVVEGDTETRARRYSEFVTLEKEYANHIIKNYSADSYYNKLAVSHGVSCSLSCMGNYCIGPEGELYKCEHHFGQKQYVVGTVWGQAEPFADQYRLLSEKNDRKTECRSCPVFPICMGGCPNSHLQREKNFDCTAFVTHLIDRQLRVLDAKKSELPPPSTYEEDIEAKKAKQISRGS